MNAEKAGAVAVIITDNDSLNENYVDMITDNTDTIVNIPSVFMQWKDGYMIKQLIEKEISKQALINIPLNLTLKAGYKLKKAPWSIW